MHLKVFNCLETGYMDVIIILVILVVFSVLLTIHTLVHTN